MKEPNIEIERVSELKGPIVKAIFLFDNFKVILELHGSKGIYSPTELTIKLEGLEEEYDEFPFYSEIKNSFIDENGDNLVATTNHKTKNIFEDLCLSLEDYVSVDELDNMNKYLPRIVKELNKQYKRK